MSNIEQGMSKGRFNREGTVESAKKKRASEIPLSGGVPEGRGGFFQCSETGRSWFCPQITQIKRILDGLERVQLRGIF